MSKLYHPYRFLVSLSLSVSAVAGVFALTPELYAQSMRDSMAHAYRNSPDIKSAYYAVEAAEARVRQAAADNKLQVTGQASARHSWELENIEPVSDQSSLTGQVNISKILYDGGVGAASVDLAKAGVRGENYTSKNIEQDFFKSVADSYIDLFYLARILEVQKKIEKNYRTMVEQQNEAFRQGVNDVTDIYGAENNLVSSGLDRSLTEGQLEYAKKHYKELTGLRGTQLNKPVAPKQCTSLSEQAFVNRVVEGNWNLQAQREQVSVAEFRLDSAHSVGGPEVAVRGSYAQGISTVGGRFQHEDWRNSQNLSVSLDVSMPFYTGGNLTSLQDEMQSLLLQSKHMYAQTKRTIELQARNAWVLFNNYGSQNKAVNNQLRLIKGNYEAANAAYEVGALDRLAILDRENTRLKSELQLIEIQRNEAKSGYAMCMLLGKMTRDDLDNM